MKHFAEVLAQRKYNLREEIRAIEKLFNGNDSFYSMYSQLRSKFLQWHLRNNYIDLDTFLEKTGISGILFKANQTNKVSLEDYLYYCEYMLNVAEFLIPCDIPNSRFVIENIANTLEQLNYKPHLSGNVWHIIEKDVLVNEAADVVDTNYDLGESIYSFNYRETQGNINRKADILCRLYKYIESVTPQIKQYGYETMLDDVKDLMNKLDIRHTATAKQAAVIAGMEESEYEGWVDELFRLSLSLIVLVDYKAKRKDIKALKAKLG